MSKIKGFFIRHKIISIILIVFILLLIAKGIFGILNKKDYIEISQNSISTLAKKDVTNSINETGRVVSSTSVDVYAEKQLPITTLNVKEGDVVSEGDIIAELDSNEILKQISQREESIRQQNQTASVQISSAKNRLNEAIRGRDNGTNSAIASGQSSVNAAFNQYKQAKKTYEDYKRSIDEGYNPELIAERSEKENLSYQEKSGNLKFNQLKNDMEENINKISRDRALAEEANRRKNDISRRIDYLNNRVLEISFEISELNNKIANPPIETVLENSKNEDRAATNPTNNSNDMTNEMAKKREQLQKERDRVEDLRNKITDLTRESENIKTEIAKLTEEMTKASGEKEKYLAEAESLEKEIPNQQKTLDSAMLDIDKARRDIQASEDKNIKNIKTRNDTLKNYKLSMDTAKKAYEESIKALETTKASVNNEINSLRDSLKQAQAGAPSSNSELKYLKESLDKTIVKAPVSGTITKVSGKETQVPTEAVVRIETVDTLRVESHIKEFNKNDVKAGTKVILTSDAVEGAEFEGIVLSVSPIPETSKQGDTPSKDVYYKTTIEIKSDTKNKLYPGMTLRVKYILLEEKDTYAISSTAIFERDNKKYVLALEPIDKEKYKLVLVEVKTGVSNDFETAISGNKIKKDLKVLSTAGGYGEGQIVKIMNSGMPAEGLEQGEGAANG